MGQLSDAKIKELVLANCGGLAEKEDSEIVRFWSTLKPETREHYIKKAKEKKDVGKDNSKDVSGDDV